MTLRECLRMIGVMLVAGIAWTALMFFTVARLLPEDSTVLAALLGFTASPVGVAVAVWNERRRH